MKKKIQKLLFVFVVLLGIQHTCFAQLEQTALEKISALEALINEAETKGIDVLKEKMTVRTAQVFLEYANWDENNITINTGYFDRVSIYKSNAATLANDLPDFERSEVILMLDEAIATANKLISGEIKRKPSPKVDWADVSISGNQILFQGKPVFMNDYSWKPSIPKLTDFFGNKDGVFMTPQDVFNDSGSIRSSLLNNINGKTNSTFGFIFLNHKGVPGWAETKYGPGFRMREDTFTAYDIDNPGAREMQSFLLEGTVPLMKGKKYTDLGYMLCNEPHFITTKDGTNDVWASGPVSEHSITKFKSWLQTKHASIANLNTLWGTSFPSFNDVTIDIPIEKALKGTPKWYDWQRFNMDRVTEWYQFLKDEINKHDPEAKVHIKLIPGMWTGNRRDHGLDFEALTELSTIIGNDAASHNSYMWGPKQEWESRYNFEWREMCMSYDFFKSVNPNSINFNSEGHFLSTTRFRDLYLKPSYARMAHWLAYIQGLNVVQTWLWARQDDGNGNLSIKSQAGSGYAGSNNQQPRIVNALEATVIDLNAHSEHIAALQNVRKSIRIFNTNTTGINKDGNMDDTFHLYESLFFDGLSIGFATENIIRKQNNSLWDAILVYKTDFATDEEFNALQEYLDGGGTVIIDAVSLKKDEYGRTRSTTLNTNSGGMIISASDVSDFANKAKNVADTKQRFPNITLSETNDLGLKGCMWRAYTSSDDKEIISIVNIGKTKASITLGLKGASNAIICENLLTGEKLDANFEMNPEDVLLLQVREKTAEDSQFTIGVNGETCPDKKNGKISIVADVEQNYEVAFNGTNTSFNRELVLENIVPGTYDLCISVVGNTFSQCYTLEVESSSEITGKSSYNANKISVEIEEGTAPFTVDVNGELVYETYSDSFSLEVNHGDVMQVKSSKSCEGTFTKTVNFSGHIKAFPNPTKGMVEYMIPTKEKQVTVNVYNIQSQLISSKVYPIESGKVHLNLKDKPVGIYFAKVLLNEPINIKIIKN
ncbi:beta-galactosidase [Flavivirga abyssicola]|uniref:beta-galactosidase n=1 Tax=Flavivirga abyssicola TaxID=3063533 RepID=UPI0026DF5655|nr:beta-galactosidase [Flavivirga sp. MEBiC07777]WVK13464.1 beta-galactosidase [Flavivirga sp. MEBiC07777]